MFKEVIISVNVRKTVHMAMATDRELFGSPYLTPLDFCLWGCMESKVY